ncbi:60S ribosomal protein L7 [Malassezia cuniculi]|uniref:60S ribosomal protein L7 n=1 Tax=Malassezia cuniculi TaxID=948313 RepID=A0AAF0ERQ8_9BASI|nr:60S ribosomal protein L7 [Malassezia cuniculi]
MSATVKTTVPSVKDVLIPETLLKKRKTDEKVRAANQARSESQRKARKQSRQVLFKRAEQYVKEYKALEREQIRLRRLAKSKGDFYVPAQPKVAFVVRLRGVSNIAPKPRKIMQLLRLLQINNGVFVKLTNATKQMLQLIEPYVTYGEPNLKTIRELVYKRGYARINRQRIPITDNSIIEEHLGKYGIVSVEDIVHEIATAGPNFKAVNQFLWPFKLSNPNGGFKQRKFIHFIEGGDTGDRESDINRLVRRMN